MTVVVEPQAAARVAAVRGALAAAAEQRLDDWLGHFTPALVWHFRGGLPQLEGDYVGLDDVVGRFVLGVRTLTGGTFRPEPLDVRAVGRDHVHAHVLAQGRWAGRDLALHAAMTYRFEGGLVAEVWDLVERPAPDARMA